ncbi:MAG: hypothetical protein IRZ33_11380 [Alicyclobacillaceae bacterium]|nr:hypothetical protein [Alicyclobacillaceae bacterium]
MNSRMVTLTWTLGTLGVVALSGGVGYEIGVGREAQAMVAQVAQNAARNASLPAQGPTWQGLSPASADLERTLRSATVQTADGKQVPFPTDKPVVVMAPWCRYCHLTLQLLQKEGLLPKVTVIAAGLEFSESGKQANSHVTLASAEQTVQKSLDDIGVKISAKDVLYALPGTAVDKAVTGYPDVFVPHAGHLYLQPGYVADARFWHALLR